MGTITRHALRVYASLSELRGNNPDVLDALIPFFTPVLEKLDGAIFDPAVFAKGIHYLYRWRFNKDIAEHFIPRLVRKGLLEKQVRGRDAIYLVRCATAPAHDSAQIVDILEQIVDEFEKFPPRVTDLLTYSRTREELKEILVRFLVDIDAYGEGFRRADEIAADNTQFLAELGDGGRSLTKEDRYMAARFVKFISAAKPDWVPNLARLAAVGLLTEVVEDFIKPVQPAGKVNLTIVIDAPLALDFLGCSGKSLQQDVKGVFDVLRGIGCSFVVFPASCEEMSRNLKSMFALPPSKRHGYTHDAMARGEVLKEFVEAVAYDPETMLTKVGIQTKHLTLEQYPNSHVYFSQAQYEDFFAVVQWVPQIEPREHDATALALTMRLRAGKHSSDLFKCGYLFATRNAKFVRVSREYCIDGGLTSFVQQGPLIHQRELATITWLRTGLGEEDNKIPLNHLMAACERVLLLRREVPDAVAATLRQVTPEKLEQFELLLQDARSIRKLADETLNDENVVTADNAEHLLNVMRLATVEEERAKHSKEKAELEASHKEAQRKNRQVVREATATRNAALGEVAHLQTEKGGIVQGLVGSVNAQLALIARSISISMLAIVIFAIQQNFTGWPSHSQLWQVALDFIALVGAYHLVMALLGRPMWNLTRLLNSLAPSLLQRRLDEVNLVHIPMSDFEFNDGTIVYRTRGEDLGA